MLASDKIRLAAMRDIAVERARQVAVEGYTPAHDDMHYRKGGSRSPGELARAAAAYALAAGLTENERRWVLPASSGKARPIGFAYALEMLRRIWPWDFAFWKPTTRRADLVKAGALILAQIELLDRATAGGEIPNVRD